MILFKGSLNWIVYFLFYSLILFFTPTLWAAGQLIGQVVWVNGDVKAIGPDNTTRVLQRRSPIYEQDTLITGSNSTAEIVFTDSSVISLNTDTTIRIDQYHYGMGGSTPSEDKSIMSIIKGGFRTITGAIPKNNPDGYEVNTPVATIGVRGTVYSAYFNKYKGGLMAKIEKGVIVIKNAGGEVELYKCEDNQRRHCINHLYAQVSSPDTAPTILQQPPAVFNAEPNLPSNTQILAPGFCVR